MTKDELIERFALFSTGNPGIESFITHQSDPILIARLLNIDSNPLTKVQLNQLLGIAEEIGVSDAFFHFIGAPI